MFCDSLRASGQDVKEAMSSSKYCNLVYGVMSVRLHVVPDGPFGILTPEQVFSYELFGCRKMVFASADRVIRFSEPQPCVASSLSKMLQNFFMLHPELEARLWTMMSSDGVHTMEEALREAGLEVDSEDGRLTAWQMMPALALAVAHGPWRDVSVALPPQRYQLHWPSMIRNASSFENEFTSSDLPPIDLTNPVVLHELAESIRASAQMLPRGDNSVKASLETWTGLLDNQCRHMQRLAGQPHIEYFGNNGGCTRRYSIVFLLRCLIVTSSMRDAAALRMMLVRTIQSLFPPPVANYFKDILLDGSFSVPSPSVLSQMRFILDAGLMLMQRDITAKHCSADDDAKYAPTYYHMFDSSPQGGMNWFMSQYDLIQGKHIKDVGYSMLALWRLGMSRRDDGLDENEETEASCMQTLAQCIEHHDNIPVGLGSGRSSLCYEVHAWYHALYMETGHVATLLMPKLMLAVASVSESARQCETCSVSASPSRFPFKRAEATQQYWQ